MTGDAQEALESLVQEAFIDIYGEYHLAIPSDELRGRLMSLAAGFTLPRTVSTVTGLLVLDVHPSSLLLCSGSVVTAERAKETVADLMGERGMTEEKIASLGWLPATVLYAPEGER